MHFVELIVLSTRIICELLSKNDRLNIVSKQSDKLFDLIVWAQYFNAKYVLDNNICETTNNGPPNVNRTRTK